MPSFLLFAQMSNNINLVSCDWHNKLSQWSECSEDLRVVSTNVVYHIVVVRNVSY